MNKIKYVDTLKEYLLPNANKIYGKGNWRFQQDNAPCHKAYYIKDWLGANNIRMLAHPLQSPDLNPMGNNEKLCREKNPKNKEQLIFFINEAWNKISDNTCINCIDYLRKNLAKIIENQGKFIK